MKKLSIILLIAMLQSLFANLLFGQNTTSLPLVIAHRGASGYAPENTIAAVQKALEMQIAMIEIDVHLTRDHQLAVIHDATIDRTTNGKGAVKELEMSYLKSLDAGSWFSDDFSGEQIPTLEEVMQHIDGKSILLIEIKPTWTGDHSTEKQVLALIRKYKAHAWCIVQSFDSNVLENMRVLDPTIELHKLVVGNMPLLPLHYDTKWRWGSIMKYKQYAAVNPYYKLLSKSKVKRLHKRGQKVFSWTIDDTEKIAKTARKGVDGIITNFPARAKTVLQD